MGKLVFLFFAAMCVTIGCAAAEDAINPMSWPKDQWRSDLFDTYPQHRRSRPEHVVRRVVIERNEAIVHDESDSAHDQLVKRPKLIIIGDRNAPSTRIQSVPGAARHCSGVLVLTWAGDRAVSRCLGGTRRPAASAP